MLPFIFISLTVSILIMFIAPVTQCGINPARDFGPRLVSYVLGWKKAFSLPDFGAVLTYVVGPMVGAVFGVLIFKILSVVQKK